MGDELDKAPTRGTGGFDVEPAIWERNILGVEFLAVTMGARNIKGTHSAGPKSASFRSASVISSGFVQFEGGLEPMSSGVVEGRYTVFVVPFLESLYGWLL